MVDLGLNGKVALVTGCARGIGKEIVIALSGEGVNIVGIDKATDFTLQLSNYELLQADVCDVDGLLAVKEEIKRKYQRLDILVNNAGIVKVAPFRETKEKDIVDLFKANVYGLMNVTRVFGELMINQSSGRIINLASTDAVVGTTGHTSELGVEGVVAYAASKGAVMSFTRALAVEWGTYNIRVNAIAPILVETPMTQHLFDDVKRNIKYCEGLPLEKNPSMKDIANAVLYLASDCSNSITGHILDVDCGYLAKSMRRT